MLEKRYRFLETESIVEMKKKKQLIHRSHEWPDENWANLERRCSLLFSDFDVNPEKGALTQSILLAGK